MRTAAAAADKNDDENHQLSTTTTKRASSRMRARHGCRRHHHHHQHRWIFLLWLSVWTRRECRASSSSWRTAAVLTGVDAATVVPTRTTTTRWRIPTFWTMSSSTTRPLFLTVPRGGSTEVDDDRHDDNMQEPDAEATPRRRRRRSLVIAVDGGTESIRACAMDAATGRRVGRATAVPYPTTHPQPGWAEQEPDDWWRNLGVAVRRAVAGIHHADDDDDGGENGGHDDDICAICLDTTSCSVVACEAATGRPLRPCLLWMDQRAAEQTPQIMATADPALRVNGNGRGPLSAEWMAAKALWIRRNEPHVWQHDGDGARICEYQDWMNFRLTGRWVASACNAATRWHWDGNAALSDGDGQEDVSSPASYPGRPLSLYRAAGMPELARLLPPACAAMGTVIGGLTDEAAAHLNLPVGLPVVQGGPDAFVGMIGLGCIRPNQLCLITGSSHLHCIVTASPNKTAAGTWGAYAGAPLPGTSFVEGGQSSTGSLLRWARNQLFRYSSSVVNGKNDDEAEKLSYAQLDEQAAQLPIGAHGLLAIETFQGSRTPRTDPLAKGALLGLTLSHTAAHIWRALLEAVCMGTRACIEGLEAAGHECGDEIVLAGGISQSPLWLQMHADVTGKTVVVCQERDAPLLGCAALAAVGVGLQPDMETACANMVRVSQRWHPRPEAHAAYTRLYQEAYQPAVESVRGISHALHNLRGGGSNLVNATRIEEKSSQEIGVSASTSTRNAHAIIVSPSLLACDWGNMRHEVQRCVQAGSKRLHVDVFDGVFLSSPVAFTFGPEMVRVIRTSLGDSGRGKDVGLDLHMCVQDPARFVDAMAKAAPGHTFIFQWEAMGDTPTCLVNAITLARQIIQAGLSCGVSLNPSTPIENIFPLLETGLVSLVDVLAVEPGFGGQDFQAHVLSKVLALREWLEQLEATINQDIDDRHTTVTGVKIMVDGGVNDQTAPSIINAGADILVSGSFLFRQDLAQGIQSILGSS